MVPRRLWTSGKHTQNLKQKRIEAPEFTFSIFLIVKDFYLGPPTPHNTEAYHAEKNGQAAGYEDCCSVTLRSGHSLFVPSGWFRASKVKENAIIFHGVFSHSFGAVNQLSVVKWMTEVQVSYLDQV